MLSHTCPCNGCTDDRYEACHDSCERFKKYKDKRNEYSKKRAVQNGINNTCTSLKINRYRSLKNKQVRR